MKKLLLSALIAVSLMSSAFASPVKEVNYQISSAFARTFPEAKNVQWKTSSDFIKASFVADNVNTEAFFNRDGDLIATSKPIAVEKMPTAVKRILAKKYEGYTVKESIKFESNDEIAYYISAENNKKSVILKAANGAIEVVKNSSL